MDLRQPPTSAFTRFSSLLKETTKRKPSPHPPPGPHPSSHQNEAPVTVTSQRSSRDERRSSSASYTDKLRHMLSNSTRPPKTSINDLPTEVLQHIFVHLDFWTLLRGPRVCRLWSELIPGDAPLLQEILYLKPSRSLQIYSCVPATFDFDFDVSVRSVEDGEQPLGSRFSVGVRREFCMTRRCIGLVRTSSEIVFHPVVLDMNAYLQRGGFKRSVGSEGEGEGQGEREEQAGSWRDMLVAMPPLRELRIRHGRKRSLYRVLRAEEGQDGVRLGELFRVMDEWAGS